MVLNTTKAPDRTYTTHPLLLLSSSFSLSWSSSSRFLLSPDHWRLAYSLPCVLVAGLDDRIVAASITSPTLPPLAHVVPRPTLLHRLSLIPIVEELDEAP
jgi:hypothetical protein